MSRQIAPLQSLPHDRFIHLTRIDGTEARIGIGAGLDFIRFNGRTCMTDIVIEDPMGNDYYAVQIPMCPQNKTGTIKMPVSD